MHESHGLHYQLKLEKRFLFMEHFCECIEESGRQRYYEDNRSKVKKGHREGRRSENSIMSFVIEITSGPVANERGTRDVVRIK